jgi:hypothetical protein
MNIEVSDIISVMQSKNYNLYLKDTYNYNVNLVAIRSNSDKDADTYNDVLYQFYFYNDKLYCERYNCTTDPGIYYRRNPISNIGTAILLPGQYKRMYSIGLHHGKYKALVQVNNCKVIRDYNKDNLLDRLLPDNSYICSTIHNGNTIIERYSKSGYPDIIIETGMFGINIHRSSIDGDLYTDNIGKYSAGCTVIPDINMFNKFMDINTKAANIYGNRFTYTLLDESDF